MRIRSATRGTLLAALSVAFAVSAVVPVRAESVEDKRARKEAEIPVCGHKIGTLAVQLRRIERADPASEERPADLTRAA